MAGACCGFGDFSAKCPMLVRAFGGAVGAPRLDVELDVPAFLIGPVVFGSQDNPLPQQRLSRLLRNGSLVRMSVAPDCGAQKLDRLLVKIGVFQHSPYRVWMAHTFTVANRKPVTKHAQPELMRCAVLSLLAFFRRLIRQERW